MGYSGLSKPAHWMRNMRHRLYGSYPRVCPFFWDSPGYFWGRIYPELGQRNYASVFPLHYVILVAKGTFAFASGLRPD